MPKKSEKARVMNLVKELDFMFSVQYFQKTIIYMQNDDEGISCDILVERDYNRLRLRIYPIFWKQSLQEQRETLLHEYCHIITDYQNQLVHNLLDGKLVTEEMRRHANEESTSRLEALFDTLLSGGMDYAKKAYKNYLK